MKTTAKEIGLKCEDSIRRLAEDFDTKLKRIEGDFLTKLNCLGSSITTIQEQLNKVNDKVYGSSLSNRKQGRMDVVDDELIQANSFGDYKLEVSDVFVETGGFEGSDGNVDSAFITHQAESCGSKKGRKDEVENELIQANSLGDYKLEVSDVFEETGEFEGSDGKGESSRSNEREEIQSSKLTSRAVSDRGIKSCKECSAQVFSRRQLVNHMVNVHGQERPFKCDRCPKQFSDRYTFRKHSETLHRDLSEKRKYYCDVCAKVLTTKSGLIIHKRTHSGEKPYECDICSSQFAQRNAIILHMRTHTKERPFLCHECSKTFRTRTSLHLHMQGHLGIKPYKCSYTGCVWSFVQKSKLAVHLQSHTGERPVICPICQKGYSKRYHVRKHIKKFHKIEDVDGVLGSKRRHVTPN